MVSPNVGRTYDCRNPTIRAIAVKERREILRACRKWGPLSEATLSEYLAAVCQGTPSPTDQWINSAQTELRHVHLPVLADAGLITRDTDAGTVDTATHPALSDPRFHYLIQMDSVVLDDVLDALSHEYRRIILTALWQEERDFSRPTLAKKIARCCCRKGVPETTSIKDITIALHHAHLPKLVNHNLITYDAATLQVGSTEHPTLGKILTIIYERDNSLISSDDGLLSGLRTSYRTAKPVLRRSDNWPHHWRPHMG